MTGTYPRNQSSHPLRLGGGFGLSADNRWVIVDNLGACPTFA
jgi:hypothetical protein